MLVAAALQVYWPGPLDWWLGLVVILHARLRYPVFRPMVVVSPGGRFALPAQGRFGLKLGPSSRIGAFWVDLVFDDDERARLLLIRDQFTESAWRQLRIALSEWI